MVYTSVKIPMILSKMFAKVNEERSLGFTSFSDFVVYVTRRKIEDLQNTKEADSQ